MVSFVPGIIKEVATAHFNMEIIMTPIEEENTTSNHRFATWRITAKDPRECPKLTDRGATMLRQTCQSRLLARERREGKSKDMAPQGMTCPFSDLQKTLQEEHAQQNGANGGAHNNGEVVPHRNGESSELPSHSMTIEQLQVVFPFHIMVNKDFEILSVGDRLPLLCKQQKQSRRSSLNALTNGNHGSMIGQHIGKFVRITRPVVERWEWNELVKFSDQNFFLKTLESPVAGDAEPMTFKGSMFPVGTKDAILFTMNPFVHNVKEMNTYGLHLNDLALHGLQRDTIFLGEYISHEAERAHELDKLSRQLEREQKLSQTLLYNMLPPSVADDLRSGKTVEPKAHDHMTLFFSDIVGKFPWT